MPNFDEALAVGRISEHKICKIINRKYPEAFVYKGYNTDYDIYVPEIASKIEVKQDFKSEYTGNFVVEIEFDGKPSALMTTKSDWLVFVDKKYLYWIKPSDLKELILELNIKSVKFIGKGDTKTKKAYLLKKKDLKNCDKTRLMSY